MNKGIRFTDEFKQDAVAQVVERGWPRLSHGANNMADNNTDSGIAALSICEALLLALNDAKLLPESEIMGVLKDAAASHKKASGSDAEMEMHRNVATLINRIIFGGNSVRRP